jgi:hypothetical protein
MVVCGFDFPLMEWLEVDYYDILLKDSLEKGYLSKGFHLKYFPYKGCLLNNSFHKNGGCGFRGRR